MAFRQPLLFLSLLVLMSLVPNYLVAFQDVDSTKNDHQIHLISGALFSTGDESPFWIRANNSQRINNASSSAWQRILFQKKLNQNSRLDWGYGFDVIGRLGEGWSGDFTQAYVEGKNKYFNLFVGRKEERLGVVDSTLSIGPLVNGNNALPIPKVAIRTNGWLNIPFTNGWMTFNGYYSHGWFEGDRFIRNALLHQKYLYVNFTAKWFINLYSGIVWNTQWGGRRSDNGRREPSSFSDYLRIITGSSGDDSASPSDQNNALGNHLGSWDSGMIMHLKNWDLHLYWQFLWEDKSGLTPFNWRDGITGVSIKKRNGNGWFKGATLEIIRTTDQDLYKVRDDGSVFTEPDNFFNNSQYKSGWTYKDRVIGNPVFLLTTSSNTDFTNRVNNLVNGINLGIEGGEKNWGYSLNYIYLKNAGTHFLRFEGPFTMHSALLRGDYALNSTNRFRLQISFDSGGKINSSAGLSFEYHRLIF